MKIKSSKAKGKRAVKEVVDLLYKHWPEGAEGDIALNRGSASGEDIDLSPRARQIFPFVIEVKNQEKLNVWQALEQAESHLKKAKEPEKLFPTLFFKRNNSKLFVSLPAEDFLKLLKKEPVS